MLEVSRLFFLLRLLHQYYMYVPGTRTDCCLLLFLNMSSYEYYWCCWCCFAYRVVPYDPSLVVASFVASLSRSYC